MQDKLRLLPISVLAMSMTLWCFLQMSTLTQPPSNKATLVDIEPTFSMMEMEQPKSIDKPPVKPEQEIKESQSKPPATPKLDLQFDQSRASLTLPDGRAKLIVDNFKDFTVNTTDFKGLGNDIGPIQDNSGLVPLVMIEPVYPTDALINKIEGWVKVRFTNNEQGKVSKAEVIASQPRRVFDRATLKAMYKAQFKPVMVDGKPQVATAEQVIEFKRPKTASIHH